MNSAAFAARPHFIFDANTQNGENRFTMNLKNLFPWLCAVGCAVGLSLLYASNHKQDKELVALRAQSQEMEQVRAELEQIKTSGTESQNAEIARLRKDNEEILRLRGEVPQLRADNQRLKQQVTVLQAATKPVPQLQQLQAENQQLRTTVEQTTQTDKMNHCINNLRQMDGAKQQWALENKMAENALPTAADIAPYMKNNVMPQCPASGVYTIGAVNAPPLCSIPGHAMPWTP